MHLFFNQFKIYTTGFKSCFIRILKKKKNKFVFKMFNFIKNWQKIKSYKITVIILKKGVLFSLYYFNPISFHIYNFKSIATGF